jgi:hypothetical protein
MACASVAGLSKRTLAVLHLMIHAGGPSLSLDELLQLVASTASPICIVGAAAGAVAVPAWMVHMLPGSGKRQQPLGYSKGKLQVEGK